MNQKKIDGKISKILDYSKLKITELNSVEGVKNSSDKLKMKNCFREANSCTADWWTTNNSKTFKNGKDNSEIDITELSFPIVTKHRFGSRGNGNSLINSLEELQNWVKGKDLSKYIFEKYYKYTKEYRLHVNEDGCFYSCRKMLKQDTPDKEKWHRHDSNSVWILEDNPSFNKPSCWDKLVKDCVNTLKSLKLDFCAFDVKTQSETTKDGKKRKEVEYIIIESNSAPSFGDITLEKYSEMLSNKYL